MLLQDFTFTISIFRLEHEGQAGHTYHLAASSGAPFDRAVSAPLRAEVQFDLTALRALEGRPEQYGKLLAGQLFAADKIERRFIEIEAAAQSHDSDLRLLLDIESTAKELRALRWELLRHPHTEGSLTTSERLLFSRLVSTSKWIPVRPRIADKRRVLIAVSAPPPADLKKMQLAPIDFDAEVQPIIQALGPHIEYELLGGSNSPATLSAIVDALRRDADLVYLACHGKFGRHKGDPALVMQDARGAAKIVKCGDLATRIADLRVKPQLMVLATCQSGGDGNQLDPQLGITAQASLGDLLAEVGVPALIAMQGFITMMTVNAMMPTFFEHLLDEGRIDRALAIARGRARDRPDVWMPALYCRIGDGRLWMPAATASFSSADSGSTRDSFSAQLAESATENTSPHRERYGPAPDAQAQVNLHGDLELYEFVSKRTLAALRQAGSSLDSLEIAGVGPGELNDFVLRSTDRVDLYRIRWPQPLHAVGFAAFTSAASGHIRQLAQRWSRLREAHGAQSVVVVHFATNCPASTDEDPEIPRPSSEGVDSSGPWTLGAFLAEAWCPAAEAARTHQNIEKSTPLRWRPAMAALASNSGLDAEAWSRFVADCELEFEVHAPKLTSEPGASANNDDAHHLAHALMRQLEHDEQRVDWTRDRLLDRLGWRYRADFKHTHDFPDPEIPYRSITATKRELEAAIERFTSGYIVVEGSPGSGKSTLLTRTLRTVPHRVARYYAYVPRGSGGSRRGEAVNFFHDLTIKFDQTGLHANSPKYDDLDSLLRRVQEQISQAGNEYLGTGRRTLILVDGLDHIPREQYPTHSLLSHLPVPQDLPDGVLFILGTQTTQLEAISPRIEQHLKQDQRRINMRLLDRRDVLEIIEETELSPAPTPAQRERIFKLSNGHPLALNYIINRLHQAPGSPVVEALNAVPSFSERIDNQYAAIWRGIGQDVELARLLALLARSRGSVRLAWVRSWAPPTALHAVTTELAYLFSKARGERWTFFHNSFRAFVIDQTLDLPALGGDVELFTALARHCEASQEGAPERADELYCRARAGQRMRVLELLDPRRLRDEFAAGRPATLILDDITLARDAAIEERDAVAFTRVLLCDIEFYQRKHYAELVPLAETWLEFGDIDLALANLQDGASLRVFPETALQVAVALDERGFHDEAYEVFTLAEPLELLHGSGGGPARSDGERDLLDAWISAAPRFRSMARLVDTIEGVRREGDDPWRYEGDQATADAAATTNCQHRLRRKLADALDELGRWDEADLVRAQLHAHVGQDDRAWWYWAQTSAWHHALACGETQRAQEYFESLLGVLEEDQHLGTSLSPGLRVALASGYLRLAKDTKTARTVVAPVEQPVHVEYEIYQDWRSFHQGFALNQVLGALGDQRALDELIPNPARDPSAPTWLVQRNELVTGFERAIARLGRVSGQAWSGDSPATSDFESLVSFLAAQAVSLNNGSLGRALVEFGSRLVNAAAAHGQQWIIVLQQLLDAEWSDEARLATWPIELMRTLVTGLLEVGVGDEWARRWLAYTEPRVFRGDNLEHDVPDGVAQARAWAAAGDIVAARKTLDRVLRAAFGSEHKDAQLSHCIGWAARANLEAPDDAGLRLTQLAAAVASLKGAELQWHIAAQLLEAGAAARPMAAGELAKWMLRQGIGDWVGVMNTLVGALAEIPGEASVLSTCYRFLILPFAREPHIETVARLGTRLRSSGESGEVKALIQAIEVEALGSARAALRRAIDGELEAAMSLQHARYASETPVPEQPIDAFDGLSFTLSELQARIRSTEDIEDLASRVAPDAFGFDWERILEPYLSQASADELRAAAIALPISPRAWKAVASIGQRLIALGQPDDSEIVERLVQCSRAEGWWERYDGGSRISAYESLIRVSPDQGRERAWRQLRDDFAAGKVHAAQLFSSWDRIVTMLDPDAPVLAIWESISHHVEALIEHAPRGEPLVLSSHETPRSVAQVVCGFVVDYLDHPASVLAEGAQQFFYRRLLADDSDARTVLAARLTASDTPNDGTLMVLRALNCARGGMPASLHEALRPLLGGRSFHDRRAAHSLVDTDGRAVLVAPAAADDRVLPPIFGNKYPAASRPRPRPLLERGAMLPPARDAADLVYLFRKKLDLIAKSASVQPEALYRYVADLATPRRLPSGEPDYSFEDEPLVREDLDRLGLRITYRRPRQLRVEAAISEAVTMLVDRGRLGLHDLAMLDWLLPLEDPQLLIAHPTTRPAYVAPIPERAKSTYGSVDETWTHSAGTENALTGFAEGGWIILAEYTWLRWLNWKYATETRVGVRRLARSHSTEISQEDSKDPNDIDGDIDASEALSLHIPKHHSLAIDEYVAGARSGYSLVVHNSSYQWFSQGRRWLAFNPALAEHLGWCIDPDGLFRWLDSEGSIMVESVWWRDGFAQQKPPLFDDEVGYGWLVRASGEGWRQISEVVGEWQDWCQVARRALEQPTILVSKP